jgi:hypothetical protein
MDNIFRDEEKKYRTHRTQPETGVATSPEHKRRRKTEHIQHSPSWVCWMCSEGKKKPDMSSTTHFRCGGHVQRKEKANPLKTTLSGVI